MKTSIASVIHSFFDTGPRISIWLSTILYEICGFDSRRERKTIATTMIAMTTSVGGSAAMNQYPQVNCARTSLGRRPQASRFEVDPVRYRKPSCPSPKNVAAKRPVEAFDGVL